MLHLIEAKRFHLNGELTEHDLWLKQKFERVQVGGENVGVPARNYILYLSILSRGRRGSAYMHFWCTTWQVWFGGKLPNIRVPF